MREALTGYMERAAEILLAEEQRCRHVALFICSIPFSERETYTATRSPPGYQIQQPTLVRRSPRSACTRETCSLIGSRSPAARR
ncbi:hypothetical protein ACK30U_08590 [Aeromonas caviae]